MKIDLIATIEYDYGRRRRHRRVTSLDSQLVSDILLTMGYWNRVSTIQSKSTLVI